MREDSILNPVSPEDDMTLRPRRLGDFVGQEKVKNRLRISIEAARTQSRPLDHVLLSGPPGLGKTTLAGIIASEMGVDLRITSGPALERPGDLAAIISNLEHAVGVLHRRDPPPATNGRGGAVRGDGGLPTRHRPRQGPLGAVDPPRPAQVHTGRRHNPQGQSDRPASGPVRDRGSARLLHRPGTVRDPPEVRPDSRGEDRGRSGRADRRHGAGELPASPTGCWPG